METAAAKDTKADIFFYDFREVISQLKLFLLKGGITSLHSNIINLYLLLLILRPITDILRLLLSFRAIIPFKYINWTNIRSFLKISSRIFTDPVSYFMGTGWNLFIHNIFVIYIKILSILIDLSSYRVICAHFTIATLRTLTYLRDRVTICHQSSSAQVLRHAIILLQCSSGVNYMIKILGVPRSLPEVVCKPKRMLGCLEEVGWPSRTLFNG